MTVEITVPVVGESITDGILVSWAREDGDMVEVDDPLFELETDKITMTVTAQGAGRLSIAVPADSEVAIGQVVGTIVADGAAQAQKPAVAPQAAPPAVEAKPAPAPAAAPKKEPAVVAARPVEPKAAPAEQSDVLSPAVRRLVTEHRLDPKSITASGPGGRLTKGDVLQHLDPGKAPSPPAAREARPTKVVTRMVSAPCDEPTRSAAAPEPARPSAPSERQTRTRMSSLRKRVAQRLLQAQQSAAILSTFNEADMSNVIALRKLYKERFKEQHGVGLGFMSFFVKAVVDALQTVPKINAQIDGDDVVQNHYYDIGVAVGTEKGLVVPVIRDADKLDFADLEREIRELAKKAREKRLSLNDLTGGCFTVSNGGVYGSLLSTPILNPPQSGILGMHAIKPRPIALDGEVVIRPMMYLALSYDHRLVDGSEAVTFLKRVVECIENPERMLLAI